MAQVKAKISMSLDGYVAGPNQSAENPLGEGGEALHEWTLQTKSFQETQGRDGSQGETGVNDDITKEMFENVGACVMGRNMFGPAEGGDWGDGSWHGWWGDNPPYHVPVYVLTNHEREPLEMEGDTTFHFVTDGVESALEQAKEAAGDKDVLVIGGADCINQCLRTGQVQQLDLHIAPLTLGGGARLLDDIGTDLRFEPLRTIETPTAIHLRYRVSSSA
jgi:dihydrofolate reductase